MPLVEVSVVVATRDRPVRLAALLEALRRQTLPTGRFEVVVVDDGSARPTWSVLQREREAGGLNLRVLRHDDAQGPASARDAGWRASTGELVAFTDDDCAPVPQWLERGLHASRHHPGAIVQGRTEPAPRELARRGAFTRSISVTEPDPGFQGCNVFYPREILERVDGFDVKTFDRNPGTEDADLAWRAIYAGAYAVFEREAVVHHAVNQLGAIGKLRVAARWTTPMVAYARHRALRRAHFKYAVFWKPTHYWLARAVVAFLLPTRWFLIRNWLLAPYARSLWGRARMGRSGLLLSPYFLLHDLIEVVAVLRAAIRYRRLML